MKFHELPQTKKCGRPLEIENGIIESVSLSVEDHGCLSGWLQVKFSGGGCGFGGYHLGKADGGNLETHGNYAAEFVTRCLWAAGVGCWEKLPGKPVRCLHEGLGGTLVAIGHFLDDKWFCPSIEFAKKDGAP